MFSRSAVLDQQRAWARSQGLKVDARGYVEPVAANLFAPISLMASSAFSRGSGGELRQRERRPAKMRALHSSAALAVNVFDFWSNRASEPLALALGVDSAIRTLTFEAQFRTRLRGTPPNLDVAVELADGCVLAIESKFIEWLARKSARGPVFNSAYSPMDGSLWLELGLPHCHELAVALQQGSTRYEHLDARQLLKHMLGLATQRPGKWSLLYLYYDVCGPEGEQHRHELADFACRLGPTVPFGALRYQTLIRSLSKDCVGDEAIRYTAWLRDRYSIAPVV